MKVHSLIHYPVKGLGGVPVSSSFVDETGLRGDRMLMLVEAATGTFLSQRREPRMAALRPRLDGSVLSVDGFSTSIDHDGPRIPVTVHGWSGYGVDQGDAAATFFSDTLGVACRLTSVPPEQSRIGSGLTPGPVGFADGHAILVTSLSSLDGLNERIASRGGQPVPMDRFRPNIVVSGWPEAHTEDRVRRLTIGSVELGYAKDCIRCAVPTVDQETGLKDGPEPTRTLASYRRHPEGGVAFGMKAAVLRTGELAVGDKVDVDEWADPIIGGS
ncbi:molybdenum cofactor sulfurase [Lentzea sp. NBRC 105346]|uniref:MOSC domain-containing protein n=1 Tax=Lentzea sp. NBRC 105346 TaxID=3032205 RepID=UPI0024A1FF37|nr:MOSC N-terminal beta barrel domain-containing protein [Lentzea sp. NBRC 105346]GLZ33290.1 molybdenum cofactor sulfurase [Lentzea sp. NBRC 105346]